MEKVFPIFLLIIALGLGLYFLPSIISILSLNTAGASNSSFGLSSTGANILAVSLDGGKTFENAKIYTGANPSITSITKSADGSLFFAGSNSGILISRDGGLNWYPYSDLEKNIDGSTTVYKILTNPNNVNEFFVSAFKNGKGIIYKTNDNFFTLSKIIDFNGKSARAIYSDGGYLYIGLSDGQIVRYNVSNGTFQAVGGVGAAISDLTVKNSGQTIYLVAQNKGMMASLDGGKNFIAMGNNSGSSANLRQATAIQNPGSGSTMYAASLSGLMKFNETQNNWSPVPTVVAGTGNISALAVKGDGVIYTASGSKIYKSVDGGTSWMVSEPVSSGRTISNIYLSGGKTVIVGTRN